MHLFYHPEISTSKILPEDESRHCVKVLRLKQGDEITVIDGKGGWYTCKVVNPHHKKCGIEIIEERHEEKKPHYVHLAIAPTKNIDRTEWFVEKAIEMGVDEISFLLCDHSERKTLKMDRMERIAVSAMKQSLKASLPKLNELVSIKEFVQNCGNASKMIAHLEEGERHTIQNLDHSKADYCLLIGPEGDFSPNEISLAYENDFKPVTLGPSRLRTETAGVAGVLMLNLLHW